ncbi:MAG: helix-turn-helix domain-containing protein [Candidatus Omnitrophica bacterium]|nr:helix-turn-helix domain-containing protein [Candidatus Omnitrophota bacterium]
MIIGEKFNPWKMFVGSFIPNVLMQSKEVTATEKLCWARLAQYAGKEGKCFPAQEELAKKLGISEAQVKRIIKSLVKKGFLTKERPTGQERLSHRTTLYQFIWHPLFECQNDTCGGSVDDTLQGVMDDTSRGSAGDTCNTKRIITKRINEDNNMSSNHIAVKLTKLLFDLIIENNPGGRLANLTDGQREKRLISWSGEIDKLIKIDNQDPGKIERVIRFCQRDGFWRGNILSGQKLRRQFDTLFMQLERNGKHIDKGQKNSDLVKLAEDTGKYKGLSREAE